MTRSVLRLGTGTVARGWMVPDGGGTVFMVVTVVPRHTARAGVRRGCRVAGGWTVPLTGGVRAALTVVTGVRALRPLRWSGGRWRGAAGRARWPVRVGRARLGVPQDARSVLRGTGTVARGWTVPAGPLALRAPRTERQSARAAARLGTGTVARG